MRMDSDEPSGSGQDMNILLRWDISDIPGTAIVESASFQLEVTNVSTGAYDCFAMLRDWDQAGATWNDALSGVPWDTAGAAAVTDRGSELLCTVTAGTTSSANVIFTSSATASSCCLNYEIACLLDA